MSSKLSYDELYRICYANHSDGGLDYEYIHASATRIAKALDAALAASGASIPAVSDDKCQDSGTDDALADDRLRDNLVWWADRRDEEGYPDDYNGAKKARTAWLRDAAARLRRTEPTREPIPMLLFCPKCGDQHVDEGEWATRPHRTHLCAGCGTEYRPANVSTVGVLALFRAPSEEADAKVRAAFIASLPNAPSEPATCEHGRTTKHRPIYSDVGCPGPSAPSEAKP